MSSKVALLAFAALCWTCAEPAFATDAFLYRWCAGMFWARQQCVIPQFREAQAQAFMRLARKAAAMEGKPLPLTSDEAVQQLSAMLRVWLETVGPSCETAREALTDALVDQCRPMLGGGE
jgi:hypothetical protein